MKRILSVLLLVCLPLASYAEPPEITVAKDGTTTIKAGKNTVIVLPDGSLKVQSPIINLTLSTDNVSPNVPPKVPVVSDFQKLYDNDKSEAAVKSATLALMISIVKDAADKVNEYDTTGAFESYFAPKMLKLGQPLVAIRNAIGFELSKIFPEDGPLTAEGKRDLSKLLDSALSKLKEIR